MIQEKGHCFMNGVVRDEMVVIKDQQEGNRRRVQSLRNIVTSNFACPS